MTKILTYEGERVIYTFDFLRQAAKVHVEGAEAAERGALYPTMMSIVSTALVSISFRSIGTASNEGLTQKPSLT